MMTEHYAEPNILDPLDFDAARAAAKASRTLKFLKWLTDIPEFSLADGTPIPADVVKGWLAHAIVQGDSASSSGRHLLDSLAPNEAHRFSKWVLETWIAYDTARSTDAEAERKALKRISISHWTLKGLPIPSDRREHPDFLKFKSRYLRSYANSGYSSRGALALAVSLSDHTAAIIVQNFVIRHAGRSHTRTTSAIALLELIARIGDVKCVGVLALAADYVPHRGTGSTAARLLDEIAERKRWSRDALVDRTASTAGLDDAHGVDLPWGEIIYRATISDDFSLNLTNSLSKPVKSLPAAKTDLHKDTKRLLSDLKKAVSASASSQTRRLYAAMCLGRVWERSDWEAFVQAHPITGRLAKRLVWIAQTSEGPKTFRPTDEGDLTDLMDERVELFDVTGVSLAHRLLLPESTAQAWRAHFVDYELEPPFRQFDRPVWRKDQMPSLNDGALELHKPGVSNVDLMRIAKKLGYMNHDQGRAIHAFPNPRKTIGGISVELHAYGPPPAQHGLVLIHRMLTDTDAAEWPPVLCSEVTSDLCEMLQTDDPFKDDRNNE